MADGKVGPEQQHSIAALTYRIRLLMLQAAGPDAWDQRDPSKDSHASRLASRPMMELPLFLSARRRLEPQQDHASLHVDACRPTGQYQPSHQASEVQSGSACCSHCTGSLPSDPPRSTYELMPGPVNAC